MKSRTDKEPSKLEKILESGTPKILAFGLGREEDFLNSPATESMIGYDVFFFNQHCDQPIEDNENFLFFLLKPFYKRVSSKIYGRRFVDDNGQQVNTEWYEEIMARLQKVPSAQTPHKEPTLNLGITQPDVNAPDQQPGLLTELCRPLALSTDSINFLRRHYARIHMIKADKRTAECYLERTVIPQKQLLDTLTRISEKRGNSIIDALLSRVETQDTAELQAYQDMFGRFFTDRNGKTAGEDCFDRTSIDTTKDIAAQLEVQTIKLATEDAPDKRPKAREQFLRLVEAIDWSAVPEDKYPSVISNIGRYARSDSPAFLFNTALAALKQYGTGGEDFFAWAPEAWAPDIKEQDLILKEAIQQVIVASARDALAEGKDFNTARDIVQEVSSRMYYLSEKDSRLEYLNALTSLANSGNGENLTSMVAGKEQITRIESQDDALFSKNEDYLRKITTYLGRMGTHEAISKRRRSMKGLVGTIMQTVHIKGGRERKATPNTQMDKTEIAEAKDILAHYDAAIAAVRKIRIRGAELAAEKADHGESFYSVLTEITKIASNPSTQLLEEICDISAELARKGGEMHPLYNFTRLIINKGAPQPKLTFDAMDALLQGLTHEEQTFFGQVMVKHAKDNNDIDLIHNTLREVRRIADETDAKEQTRFYRMLANEMTKDERKQDVKQPEKLTRTARDFSSALNAKKKREDTIEKYKKNAMTFYPDQCVVTEPSDLKNYFTFLETIAEDDLGIWHVPLDALDTLDRTNKEAKAFFLDKLRYLKYKTIREAVRTAAEQPNDGTDQKYAGTAKDTPEQLKMKINARFGQGIEAIMLISDAIDHEKETKLVGMCQNEQLANRILKTVFDNYDEQSQRKLSKITESLQNGNRDLRFEKLKIIAGIIGQDADRFARTMDHINKTCSSKDFCPDEDYARAYVESVYKKCTTPPDVPKGAETPAPAAIPADRWDEAETFAKTITPPAAEELIWSEELGSAPWDDCYPDDPKDAEDTQYLEKLAQDTAFEKEHGKISSDDTEEMIWNHYKGFAKERPDEADATDDISFLNALQAEIDFEETYGKGKYTRTETEERIWQGKLPDKNPEETEEGSYLASLSSLKYKTWHFFNIYVPRWRAQRAENARTKAEEKDNAEKLRIEKQKEKREKADKEERERAEAKKTEEEKRRQATPEDTPKQEKPKKDSQSGGNIMTSFTEKVTKLDDYVRNSVREHPGRACLAAVIAIAGVGAYMHFTRPAPQQTAEGNTPAAVETAQAQEPAEQTLGEKISAAARTILWGLQKPESNAEQEARQLTAALYHIKLEEIKSQYETAIDARLKTLGRSGMTPSQKEYLADTLATRFLREKATNSRIMADLNTTVTRYADLNREYDDLVSALKGTAHTKFDDRALQSVDDVSYAVEALEAEAREYLCNRAQPKDQPISEADFFQNDLENALDMYDGKCAWKACTEIPGCESAAQPATTKPVPERAKHGGKATGNGHYFHHGSEWAKVSKRGAQRLKELRERNAAGFITDAPADDKRDERQNDSEPRPAKDDGNRYIIK